MDPSRASTSKQAAQTESPEQLIDVFKAAALSVTKLYKTSAAAESRARSEGYQECLDDLLAFLDRKNLGLGDGEGWKVRQWATERLDGQEPPSQQAESDEEADRAESRSSPEMTRASAEPQPSSSSSVADSAPPATESVPERPAFVVPTSETFNFSSSHQYPNIATLDLSDTRAHDAASHSSRASKARSSARPGPRSSHLGRGAGSKRRPDFDDFWGGFIGGKDIFGPSNKRSRHG